MRFYNPKYDENRRKKVECAEVLLGPIQERTSAKVTAVACKKLLVQLLVCSNHYLLI